MSSPKPPFEGPYGPPLTPKPSDNKDLYREGDDIPEGATDAEAKEYEVTRVKLGDYVSAVTKVNHYNLEGGSTPSSSHHDPAGPPPIVDSYKKGGAPNNVGAKQTFLDETLEKGAVKEGDFTLTGISEYKSRDSKRGEVNPFYQEDGQGKLYKKGVQESRGEGHTLLSSIAGHGTVFKTVGEATKPVAEGPHPIQSTVATILKNNRFHPSAGSPYVSDGAFSVATDGAMGSLQERLGRYDPDGQQLLVSDLMKIGRRMMVRGTQHDQDGGGADFFPTGTQMGMPRGLGGDLKVSVLRAPNFTPYTKMSGGYILPNSGGSSIGNNVRNEISSQETYGHLNSWIENFVGVLPMGMITAAVVTAALIAVQALAIFILYLGISLIPAEAPEKKNPFDPRTLPMGKAQFSPSYDGLGGAARGFFINAFGIPRLVGKDGTTGAFADISGALYYLKALFYGMGTMFGLSDWDGINWLDVPLALMSPGQAGYAATMFRVANRDLEDYEIIAAPLTEAEAGVSSKIGAALGLIMKTGEIKSIRMINLFAKIGDIMIQGDTLAFNGVFNKDPDLYPENGLTRTYKSRVGGPKGKADPRNYNLSSVLRASALPSAYLVPNSYDTARKQYALPGSVVPAPHTAARTAESVPRLSRAKVQEIEDKLDAEFVPFYFHDLRTNEIVAFHAFLDSISDDYSPEWNSVGGFGRMDPVQIYSKTSRSISISFLVAATNPEDHDYMWWQLNKLVTLVYPQWSPGTAITDPTSKNGHIMPFSQVPAASPIIRLRIGDVIRSNYSRFNLARMFGIGIEDKAGGSFNITGSPVAGNAAEAAEVTDTKTSTDVWSSADEDAAKAIKEKRDNFRRPPSADGKLGLPAEAFAEVKGPHILPTPDGEKIQIPEDTLIKIVEATTPGAIPFISPPGDNLIYKATVEDGFYKGKEIYIPQGKLAPHPGWEAGELLPDVAPFDPEAAPEDPTEGTVAGFFLPNANAVVRSFESTAGRGLAVACQSFAYDYSDATWRTHVEGAKAPKFVKVSMSFAVIHDLPPGIDSDGFNRAPIYPVGKIIHSYVGADMHNQFIKNPKQPNVEKTQSQKDAETVSEASETKED